MKAYKCELCNKEFEQKSHYTKHKNKKTICISKEQLSDKIKSGKIKKELVLKKKDGTIIWSRKEELKNKLIDEDNKESENLKSQFDTLIKQCHQILYNNSAIVGKKAMDDIMKLLTLKLLQPLFKDDGCLKKEYDIYFDNESNVMKKKIEKSYNQCINMTLLANSPNIGNDWKNLVNNLLFKIIPNIYDENDTTFNGSEKAIKFIIDKIEQCNVFSKLLKEKDGIKYYDSISGQIYEYFMNKYVSGGGKDLGQFFTPRYMIDTMIYGLEIEKYVDINKDTTIYDPCAGSGGFLTRLFNCFPKKINPTNIYGGEVEKDTMKFCISNLLLTTSTFCKNLVNENSILYEDDEKHDIIFTNPPFGTSMQYGQHTVKEGGKNIKKDGLMEEYNNKYHEDDRETEFKDIYPVKTNDGACLFTQKCVHKLKDNGLLSIVLPDGQLFFGKNFRKFRKWLSEQINIRYIIQAPSGTFEHAGIKTCVIMATKDKQTEKIQFLKTDKECNYLEKIVEIDSDDLMLGEYSLDPKDYLEDEYLGKMMEGSCVEWKALGDMCDFKAGKFNSKDMNNKGNIPFYNSNADNPVGTYDKYCFEYDKYLILTKDGGAGANKYGDNIGLGKVFKVSGKSAATTHQLALILNNKNAQYDYLYLYLRNTKNNIMDLARYTTGLGCINSNKIKQFKIPIPSLEIQQKIVTELDQLEEYTKALKQVLEHTKKTKEIYQRCAFIEDIRKLLEGCEWKPLGDVCEFVPGKRIKSKYGLNTGKYPLFYCSILGNLYTNEYTYDQEGIMINKTNGSGRCMVYYYNGKYSVGESTHHIKSNIANNKYIYYDLFNNIPKLESKYEGANQKSLSNNNLQKIKIPIPSIEIQEKCIKVYQQKEIKLHEYDKEIEKIENNIKHNQELGKQVIAYYITEDTLSNTNQLDKLIDQDSDNEQLSQDEELNSSNEESNNSSDEELINLKKIKNK
jgi:type I restriction enzyme S subunit